MGFLGSLTKKQKIDPIDAAKEKADAAPNDPRLAHDVANQLHLKGDHDGALEFAMRAAKAHHTQGFSQRALAELKQAKSWGEPSIELLREMADLHIELGHKQDARDTLLTLRRLYQSKNDTAKLTAIDSELTGLGPGR